MDSKMRFSLVVILVSVFFITNCTKKASKAIDSRNLSTNIKMSDSIFLEPVTPEKQIIWFRLRSSAGQDQLDISVIKDDFLKRLKNKKYTITNNPHEAQFRLDANILYMDLVSDSLTADGAILGGFGGALSRNGDLKSTAATGAVGAAVGAAVGTLIRVNNYALIVDLQVSEKIKGSVQTRITAKSASGGETGGLNKMQQVNKAENFLHHRARLAATATQTNLELKEAVDVLSQKVSSALSGLF